MKKIKSKNGEENHGNQKKKINDRTKYVKRIYEGSKVYSARKEGREEGTPYTEGMKYIRRQAGEIWLTNFLLDEFHLKQTTNLA